MKYYYALKVVILNGLIKLIGIHNQPEWMLNWFMNRYIYNLNKLCILLNDTESIEKIKYLTK